MLLIIEGLTGKLSKPFAHLSIKDRVLQSIRLITCILATCFSAAALLAPVFTNQTYVTRIDCSHTDVSLGLYNSLKSAVLSNTNTDFTTPDSGEQDGVPLDSSLTNSEVILLTQYAESEVGLAAQFTLASLWTWCSGNFETNTTVINGTTSVKSLKPVLSCNTNSNSFLTDYRSELEAIGLEIILSYAYETDQYMDAKYEAALKSRNRRYKMVPSLLIVGVFSQFAVLILTFIIYSNRGPYKDLTRIKPAFMNTIGFCSILLCLSLTVASAVVSQLIYEIGAEIKKHMGTFGVKSELGYVWFLVVWTAVTFSMLSALTWIIPLWCSNQVEDDYEGELASIPSHPYRDEEVPDSAKKHTRFKDMFHTKNEIELRKIGEQLSKKASVRRTKSGVKKPKVDAMGAEDTRNLLYEFHRPRDVSQFRETTYDGYQEQPNRLLQISVLNDDEAKYLESGNVINKLV